MAYNGNKENIAGSLQEPFASIKRSQINSRFNSGHLLEKTRQFIDISSNSENDDYSFKQREATKTNELVQNNMRPPQQRRALGDITNRDKRLSQQVHTQQNLKEGTTNSNVQRNSVTNVVPLVNNEEEIEYMPKEKDEEICLPEVDIDMDALKNSFEKWKTKPFSYLTNSRNGSTFFEADEIPIEFEGYENCVEQVEPSWSVHSEDPLPTFGLPHIEVDDLQIYKCT